MEWPEERMQQKPLRGKIRLAGVMRCETGLHIGTSAEALGIGGIDRPVVRHPATRRPYVPGSSLRGKLRALLERALNLPLKRPAGPGTYRHECGDPQCPVCRLFGAVGESWRAPNLPARLRVRDLPLTAESTERLRDLEGGLDYTELKFEMALGRSTQAANLRQIERVPAGAEFAFELLYDVERPEDIEPDLRHILQALALLEDDALGGHGARGYGRVRFRVKTMEAQTVDYYRDGDPSQERRVELSEGTIAECRACLPEMVNLFW